MPKGGAKTQMTVALNRKKRKQQDVIGLDGESERESSQIRVSNRQSR
jgi:hypothetical protein